MRDKDEKVLSQAEIIALYRPHEEVYNSICREIDGSFQLTIDGKKFVAVTNCGVEVGRFDTLEEVAKSLGNLNTSVLRITLESRIKSIKKNPEICQGGYWIEVNV